MGDNLRVDKVKPAKTCRCGHGKGYHEHYRAGTECVRCDCPSFKRAWPWTRRVMYAGR